MAFKEQDLFEYIEAHSVDLVLLTETWEKPDNERWSRVKEFICRDKDWGMASNPRKRKDKKHGGGTMVLWNQKKLTRLNLDLPKQRGRMEWTSVALKSINGHRLVVSAVYVAPDIINKAPDQALNGLVDNLLNKVPGASVIVGGDFNGCDHRLEMNQPRLSEHPSPPTWPNVNPTRRLDLMISDVLNATSDLATQQGLKNNESDARSDHLILEGVIDIKKVTPFIKPRQESIFRAGGQSRKEALIKAIDGAQWSRVTKSEGAEAKAEEFMAIMLSILNKHRPWRRGIRRRGDPPWMTEGLRKMSNNKSAEYRRNGYSEKFKRLRKATEKAVKARRAQYFKEQVRQMLRSDPSAFYRKFKELFELSEDAGWTPYDAVPDEDDREKARETMADFFSNISQEYKPLQHTKLPHDDARPIKVNEENLAQLLRKINVPGAGVDGDVDANTLRSCSDTLAKPLANIYNAMFEEGHWPSCWKKETCVILPKKPGASDLGKTRPISMTSMWSKMGERVLWSFIEREIGHLHSKYQFGARKGIGAAHMMSLVLHNLLLIDDEPGLTPALLGFDLQKAFNRGDHMDMVNVLKAKGLPNWTVNTMAAFLQDRKLKVKVGNDWSTERPMPGGIGQGTIGGPSLFTLVTESLDDALAHSSVPSAYIDDRSAIVALQNDAAQIDPNAEPKRVSHNAAGAQRAIDDLQDGIDRLQMRLNGTKTEVVIFDKKDKATNHIDLQTRDGPIQEMGYEDSFKLVGWTFKRKLDASAHIKAIITKANQKKYIIRRLKEASVGKQFLIRAYITFVRPCIEYLSVVYDALLTKEESGMLETCQRDFLRLICGHKTSYKDLLSKNGLERLDTRRQRAVKKFCEKVNEDSRFQWFDQTHDERLRARVGARPPRVRKEATRRSPIHHFRRVLLGETYKAEVPDAFDEYETPAEADPEEGGDILAWFHPD